MEKYDKHHLDQVTKVTIVGDEKARYFVLPNMRHREENSIISVVFIPKSYILNLLMNIRETQTERNFL